MRKNLSNKIERFLGERRRSTVGLAEVKPEDVEELCVIIMALIEAKFERDPDGDLPVEFKLVDRTRFEPMHFEPVPYLGLARCDNLTPDQKQDILDIHMMNLSIAHERLSSAHRILKHERREKTSSKEVVPLFDELKKRIPKDVAHQKIDLVTSWEDVDGVTKKIKP